MGKQIAALGIALVLAFAAPSTAAAFCGFYVNGAGSSMFNDATQVVLLRAGTRTVLAMQNNYQGPAEGFAMVVPVPVVLKKDDVKTLPKEVFARVDAMGAPRLVEYWELDPCAPEIAYERLAMIKPSAPRSAPAGTGGGGYGVKIEAQFVVGEYQIVILSAQDSTGLDRWLRDSGYQIPAGAEPLLRPYVEAGSKFFVAKVDPKKVTFEDGRARLSPLRFHYDSEEFNLPIRLGLANSAGVQDLIVTILAPGQRYELANYRNVTIPTNLDVTDDVRDRFGEFYAALFDRTVEKNPGAVVTEYAWSASSCDPCPGPTLSMTDFSTLGVDVLGDGVNARGLVLTRLHARYGKSAVPDDLVFKAAPPIVGGREVRGADGKLEERAQPSGMNNFQGRYAIRHPWTGKIECEKPIRGRWGGPPAGQQIAAQGGRVKPALDLAHAPRGKVQLPLMVAADIPELAVRAGQVERPGVAPRTGTGPSAPSAPSTGDAPAAAPGAARRGCGCGAGDAGGAIVVLAVGAWVCRRRRV